MRASDEVSIVPAKAARPGPIVSVVIPTRNRPDSLARTLASVATQSFSEVETIVVDDSSDTPVTVSPPTLVIRNVRSQGASDAKNRGLWAARGEFVLFLDDDVELVGCDLINRALGVVRAKPDCAIVGFRQFDSFGTPLGEQPANVDRPSSVARFFTYGCLGRRLPLVEAGGFEAGFGYYYEENDLAIRLLNAGYNVLYDPSLGVVHHYDPRNRDWRRIRRLLLRNAGFSAILRYPAWCIILVIIKYVINFLSNTTDTGRMSCFIDLVQTLWEWTSALPGLIRRRRPVRYATLVRMKQLSRSPESIA